MTELHIFFLIISIEFMTEFSQYFISNNNILINFGPNSHGRRPNVGVYSNTPRSHSTPPWISTPTCLQLEVFMR